MGYAVVLTARPLVALAACVAAFAAAPGAIGDELVRVRVEGGWIAAPADGSVARFVGVPYARPPVGPLRWRPPQPPPAWSGVRDASAFGPSCMQPSPPHEVLPSSPAATLSENCLTLNVWAPIGARSAPVMVWLHGGGNVTGTGADRYADGSAFARDGIVLVTLNYRLGVFGFFAHPALIREAAGAEHVANYGLMDQLAALRWVARNISAFGGDPSNVTVFGESAGGEDIVALLGAPSARGTFGKAIVESAGFWDDLPSLDVAKQRSSALSTLLGLPGAAATAAQLRAVSADALQSIDREAPPGPFLDGRLLERSPIAAFAAGGSLDVPIVIGTNGNESSLLGDVPPPAGDIATDVSAAERSAFRDSRELFTDRYFAAPARWLAAHRASRSPVYLYRFAYVADYFRGRRAGADHGSEIPFVFGTFPDAIAIETDRDVVATVHGCWVAFAKTGVPACPHTAPWPPYTANDDQLMLFGERPAVVTTPDRHELDVIARGTLDREASAPVGGRRLR